MKNSSLCLLVFIFSLSALAQEISNVEVGFGKNFKEGYLSPLFFTLVNRNTHTEVVLSVSPRDDSVTYEKRISLPAPSQKQAVFYIRLKNYDRISYTLRDLTNQKEVTKELELYDQKSLSSEVFISLNVCPEGQKRETLVHDGIFQSAVISPAHVPDHYAGFESVRQVILSHPQEIRLNKAQMEALIAWSAGGGILVVANAAMCLRADLPLLTPFPKENDILENRKYHISPFGRGKVVWIADSIDTRAFKESLSTASFRLHPTSSESYYYPFHFFKTFFQQFLVGEIKLGWAFILIFLYVFCIGPMDYFVTKKYKKKLLTWAIFISSIAFFSCAAYLISYWFKAGPMKMVVLNCLDQLPESDVAIGRSFFGIYSTRNATYTLGSSQSGMMDTLNTSRYETERFSPSIVEQQLPGRVRARIPIYSYKGHWSLWTSTPLFRNGQGYIIQDGRKLYYEVDLPVDLQVEKGYVVCHPDCYELRGISAQHAASRYALEKIAYNYFSNHDFLKNKMRWEKNLPFFIGQDILKYLSYHKNADPNQYNAIAPCVYEAGMNFNDYLERNPQEALVLLFVRKSLNEITIEGESPQLYEINVIRMTVPVR